MKKITLVCILFTFFGWQAQAQFAENFDAGTTLPVGWNVLDEAGVGTWMFGAPGAGTAHSGTNVARIVYDAVAHDDYLVTPQIAVVAGVNDRITFWVRNRSATYVEHFDVKLSTAGATALEFTDTMIPDTAAPQTWTQMTIDLTAYIGQSVYVGFHAVSADQWELYFDDIVNDAAPAVIPNCATNLVATPDATCGNFPAILTWDVAGDATGYNLSIGTTPGGTDVLNNQNLGLVTTYTFTSPMVSTTYYWNLTPYNGVGPATGCTENTFATGAGCYCTPAPSSVDDQGITNVTYGTINNTTVAEAGNYGDYSVQSTDAGQGLSQNVAITFETDVYTYDTKIWVDWNNDLDFGDAGEEVYFGTSSDVSPNTLLASFIVPGTASLGLHRMRIGALDVGGVAGVNVVPCYTGTWGTYEDYSINVVVATCTPPVATASIMTDCGNNQFFVDVNVTSLGSGTPSITDGTTTWPIAGIGMMMVGPFADASSVTLSVLHGSDSACNLPLGSFTNTCPPLNDDCTAAITISTLPYNFSQDASGATNNAGYAMACGSGMNDGVWYTFTVDTAGDVTIAVSGVTGWDPEVGVYSGSCGTFACEGYVDNGGTGGAETITIPAMAPGQYWVNIGYWEGAFDDSEGPLTIDVTGTAILLGTNSFDNAGFSYYPNPVKNSLNLSYTQTISDVAVYNLLGQQVIAKPINANQSQIDMSGLSSGTYIVRVTADNQVKMIKVVKE